jgi:thiol-disulfide isomerase/thioredoxin
MNLRSILLVTVVAITGVVAGMWVHLLVDDQAQTAQSTSVPLSQTAADVSVASQGGAEDGTFQFSEPLLNDASLDALSYYDANGKESTLGELNAELVLLNLWATWCGPCRAEMPTLDNLQSQLGEAGLEVVALSIDANGHQVVPEFYDSLGIKNLNIYLDPAAKAPGAVQAMGVPTTLLIDANGAEIGRHLGPAEWDSEAVVDTISKHLESQF